MVFERRRASSYDEADAAFGGLEVGSNEYVEDPVTGTALVYGDYVHERAPHLGYDLLRWEGLIVAVDWDRRTTGGTTDVRLAQPGASRVAHAFVDAPFVQLSGAEQREVLRIAAVATLARDVRVGRPLDAVRIVDPGGRRRPLTAADGPGLPLPDLPSGPRVSRDHRARLLRAPRRNAENARHPVLVDRLCAEAFDCTVSARAESWSLERRPRRDGTSDLVLRATAPEPPVRPLTSRHVSRARPTLPTRRVGPLVSYHERQAWVTWGDDRSGPGARLTRVEGQPDAFRVDMGSWLREGDPSPERMTALRAACEAVLAYEALLAE